MSIWKRLFGRRTPQKKWPTDEVDFDQVWDLYSDQWPENDTRYTCWKPASLLPASKDDVRLAVRAAYAKWPEVIDWQIYSAFFMEYIDIALHLPQDDFEAVKAFRTRYGIKKPDGGVRDPLLSFYLSSVTSVLADAAILENDIVCIRDDFTKYIKMDHPAADDQEIAKIRAVLLASATEFVSQVAAWRAYIVSIGRDTYVK